MTPSGVTGTFGTVTLSGGVDAELHVVTQARLTQFFNTEVNRLQQGDSLCIWYSSDVERRQSIVDGETSTEVPVASLFNSRVAPEKLSNAVPIFVVPDGVTEFGVLTDGTRCDTLIDIVVGAAAAALEADLASQTAPAGASLVGAPAVASSPTSLSAGTVQAQIAALLAAINARILMSGGSVTGALTVQAGGSIIPDATGRTIGTVGARFNHHIETLNLYNKLLPGAAAAQIGDASNLLDVYADYLQAESFVIGDEVARLGYTHVDGDYLDPVFSSVSASPDSTKILFLMPEPADTTGLSVYYDTSANALQFVYNAAWNHTLVKWELDDVSVDPTILELKANSLKYAVLETPPSDWNDDFTASGWGTPRVHIDSSTGQDILTNAATRNEFYYTAAKTRYISVPVFDAVYVDTADIAVEHNFDPGAVTWSTALSLNKSGVAAGIEIIFPIYNLPHNSTIASVAVQLDAVTDVAEVVRWGLYRATKARNAVTGIPTTTTSLLSAATQSFSASAGVQTQTGTLTATTTLLEVDNQNYTYFLMFEIAIGTTIKFFDVSMTVTQTEVNV